VVILRPLKYMKLKSQFLLHLWEFRSPVQPLVLLYTYQYRTLKPIKYMTSNLLGNNIDVREGAIYSDPNKKNAACVSR
jgi:hypothetical protein